jgi:chaperonin GroES
MEETFGNSPIVRPDIALERPKTGTVVATGPGRVSKKGKLIPTELTAGDRVVVPWTVGTDLYFDGIAHCALREDEILAVVE